LSASNVGIGSRSSGPADFWDGEIGFLYFSTEYIDFSLEENRLKFVDGLGNPRYIGQNGELPTGSAPLIYMPFKDADNLGYNAGT